MKAADIEWSMLRGALVGLAIALAVASGMLGVSYRLWESADKSLQRAHTELRIARHKYRTVDEEEAMIADYYPRFQALEDQGIIGAERRLDWIENLRRADEALKLPRLAYSINSRQLFTADFPLADGAFRPYASKMTLTLGLLHGRDLFERLDRLDQSTQGIYSVDFCDLVRQRDSPGTSGTEVHVTGKCQLRWYTIKKPDDGGAVS
jgi:hypothetical protein